MSKPIALKINRWDLLIIGLTILITLAALEWASPMVNRWAGTEGLIARLILSLAMMGVFLMTALYASIRFIQKGLRWVVIGMALLPMFYAGMLLGGLRSLDVNPGELTQDHPRAQEVLSALWWAKQAALDLPKWSRGGTEFWYSTSGGFFIITQSDTVEMAFSPSIKNPKLCEQILSDFASQISAVRHLDARIHVNEKVVSFPGSFRKLCQENQVVKVSVSL